jgi:hypothetical protein
MLGNGIVIELSDGALQREKCLCHLDDAFFGQYFHGLKIRLSHQRNELLEISFIWFGYIARQSQWGREWVGILHAQGDYYLSLRILE